MFNVILILFYHTLLTETKVKSSFGFPLLEHYVYPLYLKMEMRDIGIILWMFVLLPIVVYKVVNKITKPKENPLHNKTEWIDDPDKSFFGNLTDYLGRWSIDTRVNSMIDQDPKFGENIKKRRQIHKDIEDLMNKRYGKDKDD